ncbi:MAG: hypothetical protein AVDCRST_MAG33-517, partial [uncultured Thermomicrobiales bacterium]
DPADGRGRDRGRHRAWRGDGAARDGDRGARVLRGSRRPLPGGQPGRIRPCRRAGLRRAGARRRDGVPPGDRARAARRSPLPDVRPVRQHSPQRRRQGRSGRAPGRRSRSVPRRPGDGLLPRPGPALGRGAGRGPCRAHRRAAARGRERQGAVRTLPAVARRLRGRSPGSDTV